LTRDIDAPPCPDPSGHPEWGATRSVNVPDVKVGDVV